MRHDNTIDRLKKLFPTVIGIDAALLYGSFGRNDATPNSDIDIQLLITNAFRTGHFIKELQSLFNSGVLSVREIALRNKVVMYFDSLPKVEFAICRELSEIDRNYIGSEISDPIPTILYGHDRIKSDLIPHLYDLASKIKSNNSIQYLSKSIADLIDKFIYEFESCSNAHRRSDGYHFYFFYNIALHVAIQLDHLSKGFRKYNFLPKYFIANVLTKKEQETFYELKGSLFLPEANRQKRKLLDFFYSSIQDLVPGTKKAELIEFCEWTFNRDFLWNFRDINLHNPKIKIGRVFRSATLTSFQDQDRFKEILDEKKIKTIIDLRANTEIDVQPYSGNTLDQIKYVKAQLDPWNQPDWFKLNHNQGTNEEIAYRFFVLACKDKIKAAMEAIINERSGAVVIHCFAGKDRTGIFISLLHLLVGATMDIVISDYLASEVDVKLSNLKIALDLVANEGGIESYLLSCGLSENQLLTLKEKVTN